MDDKSNLPFHPVPKPQTMTRKKRRNIPTAIRQYVRNRDNHQCVICGYTKGLQLHHVIPKGRYDQRFYTLDHVHDPRNLATVCGICHRKIHDDPAMMDKMLEWQRVRFGNVRKEFDSDG